jgi:hypothetical protein
MERTIPGIEFKIDLPYRATKYLGRYRAVQSTLIVRWTRALLQDLGAVVNAVKKKQRGNKVLYYP